MKGPAGRRCQAQAQLLRELLVRLLGGQCQDGFCFETEALEFDHRHGREWEPNRYSRLARIGQYFFDAFNSEIRLLCRTHNAVDGNVKRWG